MWFCSVIRLLFRFVWQSIVSVQTLSVLVWRIVRALEYLALLVLFTVGFEGFIWLLPCLAWRLFWFVFDIVLFMRALVRIELVVFLFREHYLL